MERSDIITNMQVVDRDDRQIRLQESSNYRRQLRDNEITELDAYQESHVQDFRRCEKDGDDLKEASRKINQSRDTLLSELKYIEHCAQERRDRKKIPYNARQIKMILRQINDTIQKDLRDDIDSLDRITTDVDMDEEIYEMKKQFERKLDQEIQLQKAIELMFESEAKDIIIAQERKWCVEAQKRATQMVNLIQGRFGDEIKQIEDDLQSNADEQSDLIHMKETHLTSLDQSNERLKSLMDEQTVDDNISKPIDEFVIGAAPIKPASHVNFNTGPEFGHKKVAWTY